MRVGSVRLVATEVRVANLPGVQRLGLADRPTIIPGNDLLAGRQVVIAFNSNSFSVSPPP